MSQNGKTYSTTDLQLASFLLARGSVLLESSRENNRSKFTLQASPDAALAYFRGDDTVSARTLFSAWRSLRTLIEEQRRSR